MLMDMLKMMTEQKAGYMNTWDAVIIIVKNVKVILTKNRKMMKEKGKYDD